MGRASNVGKLRVNGLFKNNQTFELRVRHHCQSQGKSAVQLMNGRGIIHLICLQQMREIRRVRLLNRGKTKKDREKPGQKCAASFKAIKRKRVAKSPEARTGIAELDKGNNLPDMMYSNEGYTCFLPSSVSRVI